MNTYSITIIHPLDECPIYKNILDTKVKYHHGGVDVIENKLSVGYIFRVAKTVKDHNMSNNVMISISKPKNNGINSKVIDRFDSDIFHKK